MDDGREYELLRFRTRDGDETTVYLVRHPIARTRTVLAAYRVGDSPLNVVTPLMAYFPLIVVFVKRYQKHAGIGTVVSLMLPYVIILSVGWTLLFVVWYLLGIPLGPGAPVHP